jgi:hypothetical protein
MGAIRGPNTLGAKNTKKEKKIKNKINPNKSFTVK